MVTQVLLVCKLNVEVLPALGLFVVFVVVVLILVHLFAQDSGGSGAGNSLVLSFSSL